MMLGRAVRQRVCCMGALVLVRMSVDGRDLLFAQRDLMCIEMLLGGCLFCVGFWLGLGCDVLLFLILCCTLALLRYLPRRACACSTPARSPLTAAPERARHGTPWRGRPSASGRSPPTPPSSRVLPCSRHPAAQRSPVSSPPSKAWTVPHQDSASPGTTSGIPSLFASCDGHNCRAGRTPTDNSGWRTKMGGTLVGRPGTWNAGSVAVLLPG